MCHHHARDQPVADELVEGAHVVQHVAVLTPIDRQPLVGVRDDRAVTRKVFRDRRHADAAQAAGELRRQVRDDLGLRVECAVPDDIADAPVEVHAGRETQVDATGPQFRGDEPARLPRKGERGIRICAVLAADDAHGRDGREAVTKPLHAAALVVHRDDQRRAAQRTHLVDEIGKLLRRPVVAAEEDQAADGGLAQQVTVSRCQADTVDVEHHRSE